MAYSDEELAEMAREKLAKLTERECEKLGATLSSRQVKALTAVMGNLITATCLEIGEVSARLAKVEALLAQVALVAIVGPEKKGGANDGN